ncbi:hypothetical protein [Myceligenerans crystallogenes]|uniref:Uncharacterized protein n=1 Tax=Myceligenerans crystallogenes TaxID=316335 RepID=A0ABN2NJA6_9MICO
MSTPPGPGFIENSPPSGVTPAGGAASAVGRGPRTVGKGPKILTFSGAAVLVLALAAGALAVVLFLRAVPLDVVTSSGEPGARALGSADVPGSAEVPLPAEPGTYAVWQIGAGAPAGAAGHAPNGEWDDDPDQTFAGTRLGPDDISVTAADGAPVPVRSGFPGGTVDLGGTHGEVVAMFDAAGPVEIEVSDPGVAAGTSVVVAEGQDFGDFFATLLGTIGAWFVAVGGGMLGFFLLVGGIIWWAVARNARSPLPPSR